MVLIEKNFLENFTNRELQKTNQKEIRIRELIKRKR